MLVLVDRILALGKAASAKASPKPLDFQPQRMVRIATRCRIAARSHRITPQQERSWGRRAHGRPQSVSVGCIVVICPQSRVNFLMGLGRATIVVVYVQQHTLSTNGISSATDILCSGSVRPCHADINCPSGSARINCPAGTPSLALPTTCKYQLITDACLVLFSSTTLSPRQLTLEITSWHSQRRCSSIMETS